MTVESEGATLARWLQEAKSNGQKLDVPMSVRYKPETKMEAIAALAEFGETVLEQVLPLILKPEDNADLDYLKRFLGNVGSLRGGSLQQGHTARINAVELLISDAILPTTQRPKGYEVDKDIMQLKPIR